jgi:hypothetical protein
VQVSSAGGSRPCWSRDGEELFYVAEDRLMSVTVRADPALDVSVPASVFPDSSGPLMGLHFDVTADGKSFVIVKGEETPQVGSLPWSSTGHSSWKEWDDEGPRPVPLACGSSLSTRSPARFPASEGA